MNGIIQSLNLDVFDPFEVAEPLPFEPIANEETKPSGRQNYFNYFSEIEGEFVRRRGSHLYLSTLDWALIQTWKDNNLPLHIALRGINESFDAYDKKPIKTQKVNSLFYCLQSVETNFTAYRESQIGASTLTEENGAEPNNADEVFSREIIKQFFSNSEERLNEATKDALDKNNLLLVEAIETALRRLAELTEVVAQATQLNTETLENDLTIIEDALLQKLLQSLSAETLAELEADGKEQLKPYKRTMPKPAYAQTLNNYVAKRARELNGIPRLSLFYLF